MQRRGRYFGRVDLDGGPKTCSGQQESLKAPAVTDMIGPLASLVVKKKTGSAQLVERISDGQSPGERTASEMARRGKDFTLAPASTSVLHARVTADT